MIDQSLLDNLKAILELGYPAIITIQCVILWRANQVLVAELLKCAEQSRAVMPETIVAKANGEQTYHKD